jgi:hypothetical protein
LEPPTQRPKRDANFSKDKKDLEHSQRDIRVDKGRISKDEHERSKDIKNRNKASRKI